MKLKAPKAGYSATALAVLDALDATSLREKRDEQNNTAQ
jgi:hypothetical protein